MAVGEAEEQLTSLYTVVSQLFAAGLDKDIDPWTMGQSHHTALSRLSPHFDMQDIVQSYLSVDPCGSRHEFKPEEQSQGEKHCGPQVPSPVLLTWK